MTEISKPLAVNTVPQQIRRNIAAKAWPLMAVVLFWMALLAFWVPVLRSRPVLVSMGVLGVSTAGCYRYVDRRSR